MHVTDRIRQAIADGEKSGHPVHKIRLGSFEQEQWTSSTDAQPLIQQLIEAKIELVAEETANLFEVE